MRCLPIASLLTLLLFTACSKSGSHPANSNASSQPGDSTVKLVIDPANPGKPIPGDFTGLSFETGSLITTGYFSADNLSFVNYIKSLGTGILRIGGNSDDKTIWTGRPRTATTGNDSLASDDVDRFFAFAQATGWKVMFSLNLGTGTPAQAADEARYVYTHYSSQLLCFEIGNEPDLYSRNGLRATTYGYSNFRAEYELFYDSVRAAVPGAVFSGPAAAGNTQSWVVPFAGDEYAKIKWLTAHYYKMGPPTNAGVTVAALLNGNTAILNQAQAMAAAAQAHSLTWRISECNSVYDGGKSGVSNTLASALWGLDFMFALAEQGDAGVNFHGGGAGAYTPIAWSGGNFSARPLYYGMLFFSRTAQGQTLLVAVTKPDSLNLTAHAVLGTGDTLLVSIVNKDLSRNAFVTLSTGHNYSSAALLRLTGPSADSTTVLLGGALVQPGGSWVAGTTEQAALNGAQCTVRVPASSAVLVTLR